MENVTLIYIFAALFGLCIGSFANVCIARLPDGRSIVRPGSHCPKCKHVLAWWENIPIISYIILRARCRGCGEKISIIYPAVEILCAALSVATLWKFFHPYQYVAYFLLFVAPLVVVTFIDLELQIIPDEISLPGIPIAIIVHTFLSGDSDYLRAGIDGVIGAGVGFLLFYSIATFYKRFRGFDGLGGGDVKLIAMIGGFFGWSGVIFVILISSILGSIIGIALMIAQKRDMKFAIPFGPFLVLGSFVYLFAGDLLINWYRGILLSHI